MFFMFKRYFFPNQRGRTWSNVPGTTGFDLFWNPTKDSLLIENSKVQLTEDISKKLAQLFPQVEDWDRLEIYWWSSGYYEPAHISRYPENDYPEEGDEERTLDCVNVEIIRNTKIKQLPVGNNLSKEIFELFLDSVYDTEINKDYD